MTLPYKTAAGKKKYLKLKEERRRAQERKDHIVKLSRDFATFWKSAPIEIIEIVAELFHDAPNPSS